MHRDVLTESAVLVAAERFSLPVANHVSGGSGLVPSAGAATLLPDGQGFCTPCTVDIDFHKACENGKPKHNNLGGLGPDSGKGSDETESIRYAAVGTAPNGAQLDLVVRAVTPYVSMRAALRNGCKHGGTYGVVHVSAGHAVELSFTFETPDGVPVTLCAFDFVFLDLDKFVRVEQATERVKIRGFASFALTNDTTIAYMPKRDPASGQLSDNHTFVFEATDFGRGGDNPTDPMHLTTSQRANSVAFKFVGVSGFTATLSVAKGAVARRSKRPQR